MSGYQLTELTVVSGYQLTELTVVSGYQLMYPECEELKLELLSQIQEYPLYPTNLCIPVHMQHFLGNLQILEICTRNLETLSSKLGNLYSKLGNLYSKLGNFVLENSRPCPRNLEIVYLKLANLVLETCISCKSCS